MHLHMPLPLMPLISRTLNFQLHALRSSISMPCPAAVDARVW
jgi:hypothetical protein